MVKSLTSKHNYIIQINITSYTDVQLVNTASPNQLFDFVCSALCEHFRACFQVCTKNIKKAAFLVFHHSNLNLMQPEKQQGYIPEGKTQDNKGFQVLSDTVLTSPLLASAASSLSASDLLLARPIRQRAERVADGSGRSLRDIFIYCI